MPSNVHIEVDPELRGWLVEEARERMISVNAFIKLVLYGAWKRGESQGERRNGAGRKKR